MPRSQKINLTIQPQVWHVSVGHGFPSVINEGPGGNNFDGEYDSLLGVPENVEALAGLTLVGDRLIGTNASGDLALLPIPSVPSNTDGLDEGTNNLYYTEARAQGVADSAIANHAGEANPHSQYALASSLGTAAAQDSTAFATAAQGAKADTALQAADIVDKADLVGGVIPTSQIPAIAISEYLGSVANEAAMLALNGQPGDYCTRQDTGSPWMLSGSDPSQLSNWIEFVGPAAPVTSVNGQTGSVTLSAANVGAETTAQLNARDIINRALANATGELPQAQVTGLPAALAAKAPLASPALTGTPTAPTPATSDDSTQLATTAMVQAAIANAVNAALQSRELPVGSIYENDRVNTNPATLLGYGTWESLGAGRALVGIDPNDADFDTAGNIGGEKEHTLSVAEMPGHGHEGDFWDGDGTGRYNVIPNKNGLGGVIVGSGLIAKPEGGGQPHNNMPPYKVVYRWVRTA